MANPHKIRIAVRRYQAGGKQAWSQSALSGSWHLSLNNDPRPVQSVSNLFVDLRSAIDGVVDNGEATRTGIWATRPHGDLHILALEPDSNGVIKL